MIPVSPEHRTGAGLNVDNPVNFTLLVGNAPRRKDPLWSGRFK